MVKSDGKQFGLINQMVPFADSLYTKYLAHGDCIDRFCVHGLANLPCVRFWEGHVFRHMLCSCDVIVRCSRNTGQVFCVYPPRAVPCSAHSTSSKSQWQHARCLSHALRALDLPWDYCGCMHYRRHYMHANMSGTNKRKVSSLILNPPFL